MQRMHRFWVLAPLLLAAAHAETIAIVGARMIDGSGAAARATTVLIEGERITAVAPQAPVPKSARVIRAEGHTLLPGLFDLHTHLSASAVEGLRGDWGKAL